MRGHFGTTAERRWDSAQACNRETCIWRMSIVATGKRLAGSSCYLVRRYRPYPRPHYARWGTQLNYRLFVPKTFRSQEWKVPMENFRSPGTKVPWNFRSRALLFSGTFVPGERKFLGTFVPGTFRTRELSFPLSDRPSRAALLCVLNYSMFGCDLTLTMLPPLWTSQLTLYVGRPASAARLSLMGYLMCL